MLFSFPPTRRRSPDGFFSPLSRSPHHPRPAAHRPSFVLLRARSLSVHIFLYIVVISSVREASEEWQPPETRRRTNLMKFQYTFNVVISIVIKHFRRAPESVHPVRSIPHIRRARAESASPSPECLRKLNATIILTRTK